MFDDGVVYVCELTEENSNGDMPKQVLSKLNKFWFERRMIGINRQYLAKGVNERVDLLVRIQGIQNVSIGQYAMLGNGDQYRITMVSQGHDTWQYTRQYKNGFIDGYRSPQINGLDYTELTLTKLEKNYDIATQTD